MKYPELEALAVTLIETHGLVNVDRAMLCAAAGIPEGSFSKHSGCSFSSFMERLSRTHEFHNSAKSTKSRSSARFRRGQILNCALTLAKRKGYHAVTREAVAEEAGISGSLVNRYYGEISHLRDAVMRAAVNRSVLGVIAQGLASNHPIALQASATVRKAAADLLAGGK